MGDDSGARRLKRRPDLASSADIVEGLYEKATLGGWPDLYRRLHG